MKHGLILAAAPLVLPMALLAACKQEAAQDSGSALDAIHQVEAAQASAITAHDLDGAVAPYGPEAVLVMPGAAPTTGFDKVRDAMEDMMKDPAAKVELTPTASWVSASGDLVVTMGDFTYDYTDPESNEPATMSGVNQTVWQKGDGNAWTIVSDFNAATAAAGETAAE